MFLIRSAFWLTAAFVTLHPQNVDLGATASALSGQAMAAGQQIVADQILKNDCLLIRCAAAPAAAPAQIAAGATLPSVGSPLQEATTSRPVFPRSRPAWMG